MPAHQLDQADAVARAHGLDARTAHDVHRRRIGTFETEAAVDEMDVVVDGLGHADHADLQTAALDFGTELHRAADGAVAADHEQDVDAVGFEIVDDFARILRSARGTEDGAALMVDVGHRLRGQRHRFMAAARNQSFVAIAKAEDALDAVAARQFEHDAAHDVIDAGTKATAGDDAAADGARIEENLVAWPGQLECRQCGRLGGMGSDHRHAVIHQHFFGCPYVDDGTFSQVRHDGGRQEAFPQILDDDVRTGDGTCQCRRSGQLDRWSVGSAGRNDGTHALPLGGVAGQSWCGAHQCSAGEPLSVARKPMV